VSSSPFNMETNSQRTVSMFSTRTLLVRSASLCSRPAKLPVIWQLAASGLRKSSLNSSSKAFSFDARVVWLLDQGISILGYNDIGHRGDL